MDSGASREPGAGREWVGAAEAARRLGVKPATLYSYVSRGVLRRRVAADGRSSLFDAAEIDVLARRGRPRHPGAGELVIESALTEITGDRAYYRGREITWLAERYELEEIAWLLWSGELGGKSGGGRSEGAGQAERGGGRSEGAGQAERGGGRSEEVGAAAGGAAPGGGASGARGRDKQGAGAAWRASAGAVRAGRAAQGALPGETLPLERLQVIVPALAAADPMRLQLDPAAVMAAGQAIMAGMVDCLPGGAGGGRAAGQVGGAGAAAEAGGLTGRLWAKLCPGPPPGGRRVAAGLRDVLRSALVLLADHELAASTLAARVAASVRADPYAVVATGLGAVGGALHGGASLGVEAMLAAATGPADVPKVVGSLLRRGERIPGFGHFVYRAGDPRAAFLLGRIRAAAPGSPRLAVAEAVAAEVARRGLPSPNIDFALGVLAGVSGMAAGAGEAVFAVARTAGWIGHALEEYARNTPLRPRARYTGPHHDAPGGNQDGAPPPSS